MNIQHLNHGAKIVFDLSSDFTINVQTNHNIWLSHKTVESEIKNDGIFLPFGTDITFELKENPIDSFFNMWTDIIKFDIHCEDNKLIIE